MTLRNTKNDFIARCSRMFFAPGGQAKNTAEIATALKVPESRVYNLMEFIHAYHATSTDVLHKKTRTTRICLKCKKSFLSQHIGNRMCDRCRQIDHDSDMPA